MPEATLDDLYTRAATLQQLLDETAAEIERRRPPFVQDLPPTATAEEIVAFAEGKATPLPPSSLAPAPPYRAFDDPIALLAQKHDLTPEEADRIITARAAFGEPHSKPKVQTVSAQGVVGSFGKIEYR